jgi:hypothetical protein
MVIYHYQVTLKIAQMNFVFVCANENFELVQMLKNNNFLAAFSGGGRYNFKFPEYS